MVPQLAKLPTPLVWTVCALTALPFLLNQCGVEFVPSPGEVVAGPPLANVDWQIELAALSTPFNTEQALFTILESIAFCLAACIVGFASAHYMITRDVTTPIIGTALFFSSVLDAFRTLAVNGLTDSVVDKVPFIPFTSAISDTLKIGIIVAGTAPFLRKRPSPEPLAERPHTLRYLLLVGVLFSIVSFAIVHVCAAAIALPKSIYPDSLLPQPWSAIPLAMCLLAGGIVLPRFHRLRPSLFSHGLLVSIVPLLASQCHAAFGWTVHVVNHLNVSLYLKILAYLVPLAGLILDYVRAYQSEFTLRTTEEKLKVARNVQQGLLPQKSPQIPGFEVAGASYSADAVGGDYFDYIPVRDGDVGIVIADVSGHELGASILLAQTRAYLRALAQSQVEIEPTIDRLNEFLVEDVQHRWFVTMFYLELRPPERAFRYAAAGHEAYLVRAGDVWDRLRSTSPPLGVVEDGPLACGPDVRLEPGDLLLLVTDGITEAADARREMFGIDRLIDVARRHRHASAREIVDAIRAAVAQHSHGPPQDDLTIVVLKCLPA